MTYNQARFRIGVYLMLSWALRIAAGVILLTAAAKGFVTLNEAQGCGPFQRACASLQNGIASLVNNVFFLTWVWLRLPSVPPRFWYLALFSSLGLCAIFLLLFTLFLDGVRHNLSTALKEALAEARVRRFDQQSYSQSVGSIMAGRDINIGNIEQNINRNPRIKNWDDSLFRSPMGQIIIAAIGCFLAFLVGKSIIG